MERTFRYIGLIQLSNLQLIDIFLFYVPELIMVFASTIIQQLIIKINIIEDRPDNYVDIENPEIRTTGQQANSISIAISIGKI